MNNKFGILADTIMGMTYEEVETAVKENAVVLFPVGVVEAHGPHLPLGTDIFTSMNQALEIKKCFDAAGRACVVAPPFYFGATQAMTRQFAGTFTSSKDTIVSAIKDILGSLDRFGFRRTVLLNAHGDDLQKKAMLQAIVEANEALDMKSYWPEYEDDIPYQGFTGEEDYLLKIAPFQLEEAFDIEKWPEDEFDIHASAFETALMMDICPQMVREDKIKDLKPTMLVGEQRWKWNEGNAEDISLVPKAYVGDPAGYKYIKAHMEKVYHAYAASLIKILE
ncbi:MAG: creatininase family protein [Lachnospiraceae bacterium]